MEYRLLGGTGVKVSALCFGTMTFGGDADEAASAALFGRCRDAGIKFFDTADAYNAIAGGLLSGKYGGDRPAQGRLLENPRYRARYGQDWMPAAVERFIAYARAHGHHPVGLAVAWVRAHPAVTAPLVGARTVAQLEDSLRSVDIRLTSEQWAEIAALVPHPGVATDRTEHLAGFGDAPSAGDPGGPTTVRPR